MNLSPLASKRWLALGLAVMVLLLHYRWLLDGGLIGAPRSDVIRGVWGLDAQANHFALWTSSIGFPEGVKLLVLPWFSSLLGAPLVWLFGAPMAWNLWVLGLCWGSGFAGALLARELTGRGRSGWIVGMVMISQPMIFLALSDGTPENVAFWTVPLFLLCLYKAQRDRRWGIAAGLMAMLVALDSPYHAIFALPLAPLCLLGEPLPWKSRIPGLLWTAGVAALGGGLLFLIYYGLPVSSAPASDLGNNAVHLQNWLQWERGEVREPWDWTFSPSFIPIWTLLGASLLSLFGARRALPWVGVGLLCLALSLGPDASNPKILGGLIGAPGEWIGNQIADFHSSHPMPVVRFLRRWLVPAALCFGLAAELGLAAMPRLLSLGPLLGGLAIALSIRLTSYPANLPLNHAPVPASATFIAEYEEKGAVLILPTTRAAWRLHQRDELPVFASMGADLSSAAELWLQVTCQRPAMNAPSGLLTMQSRRRRPDETRNFIRDLDDLTLPQTIGVELPPSATTDFEKKTTAAARVVHEGHRFLLIDEAAFGEEGMALLRKSFAALIKEDRHFEDGTGVTVIVLGEQTGAE